jgi:hypothetical protein
VRDHGAAEPDLPERPVRVAHEETGDDRLGVPLPRTPVVEPLRLPEALEDHARAGARVADEVHGGLAAVARPKPQQLVFDAVGHVGGQWITIRGRR